MPARRSAITVLVCTLLLACSVVAILSQASVGTRQLEFRGYIVPRGLQEHGFYLVSWGKTMFPDGTYEYPFEASESKIAIEECVEDSANSVTIYWRCIMPNRSSSEIELEHPWAIEPDSAIVNIVNEVSSMGITHIELMPTIYVDDGTWSGEIAPENVSAWFQRYRQFIDHYAGLAETLRPNVTSLCIGHELKSMLIYKSEWAKTIDEVRSITNISIGYHAATQEWQEDLISFDEDLDYLGINLYFSLVPIKDPTVQEIVEAWSPHVQEVIGWHNVTCPNLRIYITACFGAFDGQGMRESREVEPGDTPDVQEQADLMNAFFRVWWNNSETSFIKGMHYYSMDLLGRGGDSNDSKQYMSALCNHKPVEDVIRKWYSSTP